MITEIASSKLMIGSYDTNNNSSRTTINFVNPEKFTASAIASDTTLLPAIESMFEISSNEVADVQYSQTYLLT